MNKKTVLAIGLAVSFGLAGVIQDLAFAGCIGPVIMGECKGTVTPFDTNGGMQQQSGQAESLRPNVYGRGVYENRYGQSVTLEPQGGGVPGEQLRITPDAYGPGVHMDQYGRPVRERPW